jgi:hypothetical protein
MTRLEATVGDLADLVRTSATSPARPAGLDRGAVEGIARAELDRGRAADEQKLADARAEGRLAGIEQKVAALGEVKPAPPVRRITRFMWPGHDRA